MQWIEVEEAVSTNSLAAELSAGEIEKPFAVLAHRQTGGRGQRGNSWESAPGENVTMSIVYAPKVVSARDQFVISQTVSVAIVEVLRHYMPQLTASIAIKWPNDIYVGDRKICGVLIENTLEGMRISRTVIGIGLNVNQTEFKSDAPNPVSMKQLAGRDFDVVEVGKCLSDVLDRFVNALLLPQRISRLRGRYFSMLWRATTYAPYIDEATGEQFEARISNIASSGHITLTDRSGRQRTYAFKEVKVVL